MPHAIVDTTEFGDITFVHTLTPKKKNIELFDLAVRPTKEMKSLRETLTVACSCCHKSGKSLLVCSKVRAAGFTLSSIDVDSAQCKVAAYCSREVRLKKSVAL